MNPFFSKTPLSLIILWRRRLLNSKPRSARTKDENSFLEDMRAAIASKLDTLDGSPDIRAWEEAKGVRVKVVGQEAYGIIRNVDTLTGYVEIDIIPVGLLGAHVHFPLPDGGHETYSIHVRPELIKILKEQTIGK